MNFFKKSQQTLLDQMHIYIFNICPSLSIKRAQEAGRPNSNKNMWLLYPKEMNETYLLYMTGLETKIPCIMIDAQQSVENLTLQIETEIHKLLKVEK